MIRPILLATLLLAACAGPKRKARGLAQTDLGRTLLQEDKPEAAITTLQYALKLYPRNWVAWNHYGVALMEKQQYKDSEKAFRKSIRLAGDKAEPRLNYGILLYSQGRYDDAIHQYEKALEDITYRKQAVILSNMGFALMADGDLARAEEVLLKAVSQAPNLCTARYDLALVQASRGHDPDAMKSFEQTFLVCGDQTPLDAWFQAGRLALRMGQGDKGREWLGRVVELAPGSPAADEARRLLQDSTK